MSEHTFEAGKFNVTYRVAKHHPNDGEPHEDWAEVTDISIMAVSYWGDRDPMCILSSMESVPEFMDIIAKLANKDLKERKRDNHYED